MLIEQEIHTVFSGGQLYPDLYGYKANFHAELVQRIKRSTENGR